MTRLMTMKRFGGGLVCLLVLVSAGWFLFYHFVSVKLVALTFDDGPYGEATNQFLDILKKEKVHATFFLLGINVEKYPAITKRIVNEGHVIGNHSYSHSNLSKMRTADFQADVRHAENLIVSATGLHPRYFRPPFGGHTPSMDQHLKDMGYFVVLWDIGGGKDYDLDTSSETIVEHVIGSTLMGQKRQQIILLHDGRDVQIGYPRQNVIQALPKIIHQLKKRHYRFVTLEQIIHQSPYQ